MMSAWVIKHFRPLLEKINKDEIRLDRMSDQFGELVNVSSKPEPFIRKVANGIATGVTILGVLGIIETLKVWFGG